MNKYVKFWPLAVFLFLAAAALFFNASTDDVPLTDEEQDRAIWEQRQRNYNYDDPEPEDFDPIDLDEDERVQRQIERNNREADKYTPRKRERIGREVEEHNQRVEERIERALEEARYGTYRPLKPLMDYNSMSDDELLDEYSRQIEAGRKRIDEHLWEVLREKDLIDEEGLMRPQSFPDIG